MAINTDYSNILRTFADTKTNNTNKTSRSDDPKWDLEDPEKRPGTSTDDTGKTDGTNGTGNVIDAVFEDSNDTVSMEDFLTLMVAQLKNQDFMNPMDDTAYITQLAQISSMQQMEEMNYNSKSTYVASLVGKTVTAAKFNVKGEVVEKSGPVEKVSLLDGEFVVYVDGEAYDMDEIMTIQTEKTTPDTKPEDGKGDGEGSGDDSGEGSGDDKASGV